MAARVTGVPQLQARLHAIGGRNGIMRQIGVSTVGEAKLLVRRKTGLTGASIRLVSSTATTATVVAGGAGAFLEFGTRPHEIRPKAKKALFFASQKVINERFGPQASSSFTLAGRLRTGAMRKFGNAAFVLTKLVHHPGTRPAPFLIPGARRAIAKSGVQAIVKVWDEAG